jgi:type I restriction enzyme R subunit
MSKKHTEDKLEDAIEHHLLNTGGYVKGESKDFDAQRALEPVRVISFIRETQARHWQSLTGIHGEGTEEVVLNSLCNELDTKGVSLKSLFFLPITT